MADIKFDQRGFAFEGINNARKQHDKIFAQETRCQRVQHAVAVQNVKARRLFDIQLGATFVVARVQIRKLLAGDFDAIALDPGNKTGVHK